MPSAVISAISTIIATGGGDGEGGRGLFEILLDNSLLSDLLLFGFLIIVIISIFKLIKLLLGVL